jgi:hypothetical protein
MTTCKDASIQKDNSCGLECIISDNNNKCDGMDKGGWDLPLLDDKLCCYNNYRFDKKDIPSTIGDYNCSVDPNNNYQLYLTDIITPSRVKVQFALGNNQEDANAKIEKLKALNGGNLSNNKICNDIQQAVKSCTKSCTKSSSKTQ